MTGLAKGNDMSATNRPRRCTENELAKVDVVIVNTLWAFTLECQNCGETWEPKTVGSGRLENGYWKCPQC